MNSSYKKQTVYLGPFLIQFGATEKIMHFPKKLGFSHFPEKLGSDIGIYIYCTKFMLKIRKRKSTVTEENYVSTDKKMGRHQRN